MGPRLDYGKRSDPEPIADNEIAGPLSPEQLVIASVIRKSVNKRAAAERSGEKERRKRVRLKRVAFLKRADRDEKRQIAKAQARRKRKRVG